jgi:hypothetical protein
MLLIPPLEPGLPGSRLAIAVESLPLPDEACYFERSDRLGQHRAALERGPAQRLPQPDQPGGVAAVEDHPRHDREAGDRCHVEAHTKDRAVAKTCHKELAELYEERLREKGLTVSVEPGR